MKKKIFLCIGRLCQGGGERVCVNLANELIKKDFDVTIVVFSDDVSFFKDEINNKVNLILLNGDKKLALIFKLKKIFKSSGTEYSILSFNYNISFYLSMLKVIFGVKYNSRSLNTLSLEFKNRNTLKDKLLKKLIVFGLNSSNIIISQSEGMKDDLILSGVNKNKITTINNPVNNKYTPNNEIKKEKIILYVGRLSEQKGLDYLIKSIPYVNKEYQLLLIGEGEKRSKLELLVTKLNLSDRVYFLGQKSNIVDYYRKAKLTVLSSHYEGFPNVLIESIASGTPVVSFDCPNGPSEIVVNDINGFLVNYLDIDDLSSKINHCISYNFANEKLLESINKFKAEYIVEKYIEKVF